MMKITKKVLWMPWNLVSAAQFVLTSVTEFFIAVVFISQLFGLFPISGLFSRDPHKIEFSWFSLRTLFSACFIAFSLTYMVLIVWFQTKAGPLSPSNIVGILFFANCSFICILFFKLSMKFGFIMERWSQVEKILEKSKFHEKLIQSRWTLKRKVIVCSSVALISAAVEHSFSLAVSYQRGVYETNVCNWTRGNSFENYVTKHLSFMFNVISYNFITGVLAEYFNISFTFYWNFLDIFLMVISIGLSNNYELINERIRFYKDLVVQDEVWSEIRSDYNKVSELLKFVDGYLDKMIVLACLNDSYFMLVQLLNMST